VGLREGCYFTQCKNPFSYDYKCALDAMELPQTDSSGCENGLVKYQCCPASTG
jgi:hypothetical protein